MLRTRSLGSRQNAAGRACRCRMRRGQQEPMSFDQGLPSMLAADRAAQARVPPCFGICFGLALDEPVRGSNGDWRPLRTVQCSRKSPKFTSDLQISRYCCCPDNQRLSTRFASPVWSREKLRGRRYQWIPRLSCYLVGTINGIGTEYIAKRVRRAGVHEDFKSI